MLSPASLVPGHSSGNAAAVEREPCKLPLFQLLSLIVPNVPDVPARLLLVLK